MKKEIFFATLLMLSPLPASAQDTTSAGEVEVPMAGENSFTESQVRERLAAAGYSAIGTLDLDTDGIWRTTAMKGDKLVSISFDYKGNIIDN